MSPVTVNGRSLGVAANGVFTDTNTDPIPGGKLWTEAAASWNAARHAAILDGIPASEFAPVGPNASARSRAAQDLFWRLYITGQGNPAAKPYTSNHGWAIAVDVKTRRTAAWLLKHGHKYGWSHDEGARVGEWWHFRYVGGYKPVTVSMPWLERDERAWVREYDRLQHERRDKARRLELRAKMHARATDIQWAAQHDPKGGWDRHNRRKRYRTLTARLV